MCYNAQQLKEKIENRAVRLNRQAQTSLVFPHFMANGFAHPKLLVMTGEAPLSYLPFRWGLIPSWCQSEEKAAELGMYTLNARSETIFEKPSFKSITAKRCILPLDGFFEWREFQKKKYPYFIYPIDKDLFSVACLWDTWLNKETGELINSFSIITTPANELMAKIHNVKLRMPLIIPEKLEEQWVDPKLSKEAIIDLMKPYDSSLMQAHTISKRISSRKENPNVAEVTEEFAYPELGLL